MGGLVHDAAAAGAPAPANTHAAVCSKQSDRGSYRRAAGQIKSAALCFPSPLKVYCRASAASSAWLRSAQMSSAASTPTEKRTRLSRMPMRARSSGPWSQ